MATTVNALAALHEFGFEPVSLDEAGAPTPGQIASRISGIIAALEQAQDERNLVGVRHATERLGRLADALRAWTFATMPPS